MGIKNGPLNPMPTPPARPGGEELKPLTDQVSPFKSFAELLEHWASLGRGHRQGGSRHMWTAHCAHQLKQFLESRPTPKEESAKGVLMSQTDFNVVCGILESIIGEKTHPIQGYINEILFMMTVRYGHKRPSPPTTEPK